MTKKSNPCLSNGEGCRIKKFIDVGVEIGIREATKKIVFALSKSMNINEMADALNGIVSKEEIMEIIQK